MRWMEVQDCLNDFFIDIVAVFMPVLIIAFGMVAILRLQNTIAVIFYKQ